MPHQYVVNVRVHPSKCPVCKEEEICACLYHGDMLVQPVRVNGMKVFRMTSEPKLTTYWRFDPQFHEELEACAMAEKELSDRITGATKRRVRLTIVGPCTKSPTKDAYAFYFGDEFEWPPKSDPAGLLVWVGPDEVHLAIENKARIPQPPKIESKHGFPRVANPTKVVEPGKPTPLPSHWSPPPEF